MYNKIDPQVYVDTQSKGLASRVVLYYEKNRNDVKPIINRMYNRPGEFPIVHLKKPSFDLNPKQNLSCKPGQMKIPELGM